jgi:hypothetical protein
MHSFNRSSSPRGRAIHVPRSHQPGFIPLAFITAVAAEVVRKVMNALAASASLVSAATTAVKTTS